MGLQEKEWPHTVSFNGKERGRRKKTGRLWVGGWSGVCIGEWKRKIDWTAEVNSVLQKGNSYIFYKCYSCVKKKKVLKSVWHRHNENVVDIFLPHLLLYIFVGGVCVFVCVHVCQYRTFSVNTPGLCGLYCVVWRSLLVEGQVQADNRYTHGR